MNDKNNGDGLSGIIRSIGENLDTLYREYTEHYVKQLIKEAEGNNEIALATLGHIARQFKDIGDSFNKLAESLDTQRLH